MSCGKAAVRAKGIFAFFIRSVKKRVLLLLDLRIWNLSPLWKQIRVLMPYFCLKKELNLSPQPYKVSLLPCPRQIWGNVQIFVMSETGSQLSEEWVVVPEMTKTHNAGSCCFLEGRCSPSSPPVLVTPFQYKTGLYTEAVWILAGCQHWLLCYFSYLFLCFPAVDAKLFCFMHIYMYKPPKIN